MDFDTLKSIDSVILYGGESIISGNCNYLLQLEFSGNLVFKNVNTGQVLWETGTELQNAYPDGIDPENLKFLLANNTLYIMEDKYPTAPHVRPHILWKERITGNTRKHIPFTVTEEDHAEMLVRDDGYFELYEYINDELVLYYSQPPIPEDNPTCLSLYIEVIDSNGDFDGDNFNGIYTYVPDRQQFNRPIWELPQDADDKNLKYYGGDWIIHAKGYDVLSYESDTFFPPVDDLNAEWKHSGDNNDGVYHVSIKCIDSYSPTTAPTTMNDIYDGTITIIYVLTNLTNENYDDIFNNDENGRINYITEIIESHYLHPKYLPYYESFYIKVLKINGEDYNDEELFNTDLVYDKNVMYLSSEIRFEPQYEFYLLETSRKAEWQNNVSLSFRDLLDNSNINFYVESPSTALTITFDVLPEIDKIFMNDCSNGFNDLKARVMELEQKQDDCGKGAKNEAKHKSNSAQTSFLNFDRNMDILSQHPKNRNMIIITIIFVISVNSIITLFIIRCCNKRSNKYQMPIDSECDMIDMNEEDNNQLL